MASLRPSSLQKTVTTPGTAEALASSRTICKRAVIKALLGNSGNIFVGDSTTAASGTGFQLDAGQEVALDNIAVSSEDGKYDLSEVYIDTDNGTDGVSVLYVAAD